MKYKINLYYRINIIYSNNNLHSLLQIYVSRYATWQLLTKCN